MPFYKMSVDGNKYTINRMKRFMPYATIEWPMVQTAYDFAYNMSFGKRGEHRDHRSGGTQRRKKGEIFKDTFQGKLAECALYNVLSKNHSKISLPSFDVWELEKWDTSDYIIDGSRASVKSTKSFGNLLLLETKDYSADGAYIPNQNEDSQGIYDYFILVRMRPYCEDLLRKQRLLYSNEADYNTLKDLIMSEKWEFDVPGYITHNDFLEIIASKNIIPQNSLLNGKIKMDASNYYVQAGDLREIDML